VRAAVLAEGWESGAGAGESAESAGLSLIGG
jgi:hypothetical protein